MINVLYIQFKRFFMKCIPNIPEIIAYNKIMMQQNPKGSDPDAFIVAPRPPSMMKVIGLRKSRYAKIGEILYSALHGN